MILADNGSDWYISGTPDKHWDNEALHLLSEVKGGDFEVVDNAKIGVVFVGTERNDTIAGNDRHNRMSGNDGADKLYAASADDTLSGGAGADLLAGGRGHDRLTGGTGSDTFLFDTKATTRNADVVTDFGVGKDRIALDHDVFDELAKTGRLDATVFHRGEAATHASDRIIYDPASDRLLYDDDGSGGHHARVIARFTGHSDVTIADIWVI
jgi:Ca2+-binding RTX toxin-like protein